MTLNVDKLSEPKRNSGNGPGGVYYLSNSAESCRPGYLPGNDYGPIQSGKYKAVKDRCYSFAYARSLARR